MMAITQDLNTAVGELTTTKNENNYLSPSSNPTSSLPPMGHMNILPPHQMAPEGDLNKLVHDQF